MKLPPCQAATTSHRMPARLTESHASRTMPRMVSGVKEIVPTNPVFSSDEEIGKVRSSSAVSGRSTASRMCPESRSPSSVSVAIGRCRECCSVAPRGRHASSGRRSPTSKAVFRSVITSMTPSVDGR